MDHEEKLDLLDQEERLDLLAQLGPAVNLDLRALLALEVKQAKGDRTVLQDHLDLRENVENQDLQVQQDHPGPEERVDLLVKEEKQDQWVQWDLWVPQDQGVKLVNQDLLDHLGHQVPWDLLVLVDRMEKGDKTAPPEAQAKEESKVCF